jgi:hypothetical protein
MAKKFTTTKMKVLEPAIKTEERDKPYSWDPRPYIDVKSEDLPDIEKWTVGKSYIIEVEVKLERYSEELNSETKKPEKRGSLRIVAMSSEIDDSENDKD